MLRAEWETIHGTCKEGIVTELESVVRELKEDTKVVFVRFLSSALPSYQAHHRLLSHAVSCLLALAASRADLHCLQRREGWLPLLFFLSSMPLLR